MNSENGDTTFTFVDPDGYEIFVYRRTLSRKSIPRSLYFC
jgi:hypothetical protein